MQTSVGSAKENFSSVENDGCDGMRIAAVHSLVRLEKCWYLDSLSYLEFEHILCCKNVGRRAVSAVRAQKLECNFALAHPQTHQSLFQQKKMHDAQVQMKFFSHIVFSHILLSLSLKLTQKSRRRRLFRRRLLPGMEIMLPLHPHCTWRPTAARRIPAPASSPSWTRSSIPPT